MDAMWSQYGMRLFYSAHFLDSLALNIDVVSMFWDEHDCQKPIHVNCEEQQKLIGLTNFKASLLYPSQTLTNKIQNWCKISLFVCIWS